MDLNPDFKEFLRLLNSHRVRFLIVGAHALAAHGRPRLTGDLDILVDPTVANARRVVSALRDFGFGSLKLRASDFSRPGTVVQLGRPPVRIDILTAITGVTFTRAWKGRLRGKIAGLPVGFLGRKEFIENKRSTGRTKDLLDVALLEEGKRRRR